MKTNYHKKKRILVYALYLVVVLLISAEIALRIYNPFPSGIKGDKIVLRINLAYEYENKSIPVLERKILHTKNSLGFRGPEKPGTWKDYLTVFTVGGSTTECNYLSDGNTWSDKLFDKLENDYDKLWLNNAGLAGHSTYGHKILLEDYLVKLHPDAIIFLVGCNDIGRDDLTDSDRYSMKGTYGSIASFFTKNSELANLSANFFRTKRARENNLTDKYINLPATRFDTINISKESISQTVATHRREYVPGYSKRLKTLIDICKENSIEPILVTQPSLLGAGYDPVTGADLESYRLRNGQARNGKEWWALQELYNEQTRQIGKEYNIFVIDLAQKMPKSSAFFYDLVHFTKAGAEKVSEILFVELDNYFSERFSGHKKS